MKNELSLLRMLIAGCMIACIGCAFWMVFAAIVAVADSLGEMPFAIIAGLSLSQHHRSSEARGERVQRLPSARAR